MVQLLQGLVRDGCQTSGFGGASEGRSFGINILSEAETDSLVISVESLRCLRWGRTPTGPRAADARDRIQWHRGSFQPSDQCSSLLHTRNRTLSSTISNPSPSAPPTFPLPSEGPQFTADGSHLRHPQLGLMSGFLCGAVTISQRARLLSSVRSPQSSEFDSTRCSANETMQMSYGSTTGSVSSSALSGAFSVVGRRGSVEGREAGGGGSRPAATSLNESVRHGSPVRAR